jgi:hypothetical protein
LQQQPSPAAQDFLNTGVLPGHITVTVPVSYVQYPSIYLLLEVADAFLDLQDHCCIYGKAIHPGLKPTTCDEGLCAFQAQQIGIGMSVCQELSRDLRVADLLVSSLSAAIGTKYYNPRVPVLADAVVLSTLDKLPPMNVLSQSCSSDVNLSVATGSESAMQILRWVLLSNRSHLISLPASLRLKQFAGTEQFMTLLSSPEREEVFNDLKGRFGSMYLWHGSGAENWHSILRTGLKNFSNTDLMKCGACYGSGIYFARSSGTSLGYVTISETRYRNSKQKQLSLIAICEVIKLPPGAHRITVSRRNGTEIVVSGALNPHEQWGYTLTMEEACVVRFLLSGLNAAYDLVAEGLEGAPTLRDITSFLISQHTKQAA